MGSHLLEQGGQVLRAVAAVQGAAEFLRLASAGQLGDGKVLELLGAGARGETSALRVHDPSRLAQLLVDHLAGLRPWGSCQAQGRDPEQPLVRPEQKDDIEGEPGAEGDQVVGLAAGRALDGGGRAGEEGDAVRQGPGQETSE